MNLRTPPHPARTAPAALFAAACLALAGTAFLGPGLAGGAGAADVRERASTGLPATGAGRASLPDLVARLLPTVVSITTTQSSGPVTAEEAPKGSPFEEYFKEYFDKRRNRQRGSAMGSGFIISADGYVVTNHHVINRATAVHVILDNGRQLDARIVGRDSRADLAVLKVAPKRPCPSSNGATPIPFASARMSSPSAIRSGSARP